MLDSKIQFFRCTSFLTDRVKNDFNPPWKVISPVTKPDDAYFAEGYRLQENGCRLNLINVNYTLKLSSENSFGSENSLSNSEKWATKLL